MLTGCWCASLEVDSLRSMYFDMKQKQSAESKKDAAVSKSTLTVVHIV